MADSTIDGTKLLFYDNWPGPAHRRVGMLDGPLDARSHNVAVPYCDVGTKWFIHNSGASKGTAGDSIFVYLQAVNNADVAIAAKTVCVPDVVLYPYRVTNDPDDCISVADALYAIAISAMTDSYYGWFFAGGVVPSDEIVSGGTFVLDGTFPTDDSVVAGDFTTVDLTADAIGFGVIAATTSAIGYAMAADG
jgi:hypothetical protein